MNVRDFVKLMKNKGEVLTISKNISPRYEMAAVLHKLDGGPVVLFENVDGYSDAVVGGIFSSRRRFCEILQVNEEDLHSTLLKALRSPSKPKEEGALDYKLEEDLGALPILTHYEGDPGPYITAGIVIAKSPSEDLHNASFHRLLVLDHRHLAIRIVPRHLHKMFSEAKRRGEDLPIAICVGAPPPVSIAASMSPPYGVDELQVANTLMKGALKIAAVEPYGIVVPVDTEIVIIGKILHDREAEEGPFVDLTGTYDIRRKQPVVKVERVLKREEKALYQAILPGGREHRLLMGIPREATMLEALTKLYPQVKKVRLTDGGSNWLHAVVSITKVSEGDGKNIGLAALAVNPSLKHVVVVDDDIDPEDPQQVEWAIATRFQGDRDLLTMPGLRGSSLDPSADQQSLSTCKIVVDATKPLEGEVKIYEKVKPPALPAALEELLREKGCI